MSRWFRFYEGALDDPKVQRLSPQVFKGWVNILCLASKTKGKLPPLADIAFALRVSDHEADTLIQALVAAGLVDDVGGSMMPHQWYERQYEDKTNKERQRKFRERQKEKKGVTRYDAVTNGSDNGPVTPVEQNRTEQKEKNYTPSALSELQNVLSEESAKAVIEHRSKMKAPLTQRAAKALAKRFAESGNPERAVETMLARGWRSYEPTWAGASQPAARETNLPLPTWRPNRGTG